jgi:hypothetical protein
VLPMVCQATGLKLTETVFWGLQIMESTVRAELNRKRK